MNEKLAYTVAKEYLRGLKLTGSLERLGLDVTDYRPNLCEPLLESLDISDMPDEVVDVIDKFESKIINMDYFTFIGDGLDRLADEMIAEILTVKNRTNP